MPWPNRLADGVYTFRGTRHQLPLSEPARAQRHPWPAALTNWTRRAGDESHAVLAPCCIPSRGYPFPLDVAIEYAVRTRAVPAGIPGSP